MSEFDISRSGFFGKLNDLCSI